MKRAQNIKNFTQKSLKQQRGLTMISWIFVLAVLVFCGMFAFIVVPMYAENMYVVKALKSLTQSGERVAELSDSEIKKRLQNFYSINNVRSDGAQHIVIDRKSKSLIITIDYENRAKLFYNIDIVTSFQNHLDGDHPNLCCDPVVEAREPAKY
jgi:hypothetical protein